MFIKTLLHRVGLTGLVLLGLAGLVRAQDATRGKKYALLVGVTEYRHARLSPLKYAENDVEALARAFYRLGADFAEVRVLTTSRGKIDRKDAPTARNIRSALEALLKGKRRRDTVVIGW
jgi:uncharacterized caspase-like protein